MGFFSVPGHSALEVMYWISQIVGVVLQSALIGIAVWAGIAAYNQISAIKLFELLKYVQCDEFRKARRDVVHQIGPQKETEWWKKDPTLENCASDCCAHYDTYWATC